MDTENNQINNPTPEENAEKNEVIGSNPEPIPPKPQYEGTAEPFAENPATANTINNTPQFAPQMPQNGIYNGYVPNPQATPDFANNQPQFAPPFQQPYNVAINTPPPKKKKKFLAPLIIIVVLIVVAAVFFLLTSTHVICLDHKWKEATCTDPKICMYCNKTEGVPSKHDWSEATCTEDAECKNCGKEGKKATGHTEGSWTVTKEATLIDYGTEELLCKDCSESLNSRSTEKKDAAVIGESFNFTDIEFISWVMENTTAEIDYTETGVFDDPATTSYDITDSDGTKGILALDHDENGNICVIIFYYAEWADAAAMAAITAEDINSSFVFENAGEYLVEYDIYTAADMTIYVYETDGGIYSAMLAPVEFIENLSDDDSDYEA
ncbi:MAG: hypothetical protein E7536_01220 [Ruminococcaceae bacterium]|nr:hypothetical protein [Oscillospiraceae bacterium]